MNTLRSITYICILILQLCVHNSLCADFEVQPIWSDKQIEISLELTSPPLVVNELTSIIASSKDPLPVETNTLLPSYHWFINGVPQSYSLMRIGRITVHSTGEYNVSVVVNTSEGKFTAFLLVTAIPDTITLEPIKYMDSVKSATPAPIESTVDLHEKVEGIAVTYDHTVGYDSTSSLTGNVKIVVSVEKGTDLTYQFNFMDGNGRTEIQTPSKSAYVYHKFKKVRNYIQICVKNEISVICKIVRMQFDVLISGLKWEKFPAITEINAPNQFSTTIASGTNVEYLWFFGQETLNLCNAWYCNYIFENIRRYNGYVEAYNLVSSQRIHFNVDVFTPIKYAALTSNVVAKKNNNNNNRSVQDLN